MVRLELDQVVMRRMREDDIEAVKALIKVCIIQKCLWQMCPFPSD